MVEIVNALKWPVVFLIVVLIFRVPLIGLVARTKKLSKEGLEAFDVPQLPATKDANQKDALGEFLGDWQNPILTKQEASIRADLEAKGLGDAVQANIALIRVLAATQLQAAFEKVSNVLFLSQFYVLNRLNVSGEIPQSELEPYYDVAKQQYPEFYETYSFERWLGFLESYSLIQFIQSTVSITETGKEFLKWRIQEGKAPPRHG